MLSQWRESRRCGFTSKQLDELVDREVRIADNAAQQWFFDAVTGMDGHHGSSLRLRVKHHQVTSPLPVFDESGALESSNHLPSGQRRKLGHDQAGTVTLP